MILPMIPTNAPRRRPRRTATAVAAAVLVLLAAACGSGTDAPSPAGATDRTVGTATGGTNPAGSAPGIDWAECDGRFECATVAVPLDWDDPDGETIDLAVVRSRASAPDQRIGTILVNPGGPGDTGIGLVKGDPDTLDGWSDGRFDWVSWDPRGTHASEPVDCFGSEEATAEFWDGVSIPSSPAEGDAYIATTTELARRCGQQMGPLLSHISTTDTVRDMDHIRELLGEEQITYVGLSYGTVVGQHYANLFPEHVRAMLLDGVVDVVAYTADAASRAASGASSTQEVFERFLATCEEAGPDLCALAGHGEPVADRVNGLFERVRRAPLPAPNASPPGELVASDLQVSSFSPLRDPSLWPGYAEQLEAAVVGDPSAILDAARQWKTPAGWAEVTKSAAISCLDGPATTPSSEWPAVIGDLAESSPLAGAIQGWWLWAPCASDWPASSDDRYTGPWDAELDAPVLLIGTRYDPNTSYAGAVRTEQLLDDAVLLTHEGYGHLSFQDPSACVEAWRTRYLVELVTPPPGTACRADQRPFGR
jgi:pimeloyl-ACP methyl ester carboxylesterase